MPANDFIAERVWLRYQYLRDNGHNEYIEKAVKCDKFFLGMQWDPLDLAKLANQRRPALTINKILGTLANMMGEQIYNRTDISFQPRNGSDPGTSEALAKVFRQISDNNQLEWKRSDMYCDGVITSRGFLDARLDFTDSMQGEVRIENINPKNVLIDADAEEYDPDTWNDVLQTKWMTWQDIATLYNEEDAELLRGRDQSWFQYGFDSIERVRDRFGPESQRGYFQEAGQQDNVLRNIRVIEQQQRRIVKRKYFVDPETGDMRAIPDHWKREKIGHVSTTYKFSVTEKLAKRIRWTVIADNIVLHDEWSPFEHFTVVPFFPYFRRGKTMGVVENLISPQELLNKSTSQELHVVNTTANSGWKLKTGSLKNLTLEELEQRGAESGLVIELSEVTDAEKITPNQVPTGLDRVSHKAEEHIKSISTVSDYQSGSAREDVSAKAVQENLKRGSLNQAKMLDSLNRSDFMLARNVLGMIQMFYTEPRLINITTNKYTGERAEVGVNQPTPEGIIANDLSIGEFEVVVTSVPHRQTLEAEQFQQAVALKELGIPIPDKALIEHSSLYKKGDILKAMEEATNSAEAQHAKEVQKMGAELELANLKADAAKAEADAVLKQARAKSESVKAAKELQGDETGSEMAKAQMEMQIMERESEIDIQKRQMELQIKQEELELKRQEMSLKHQGMQLDLAVKAKTAQADSQIAEQKVRQQEEQHQISLRQQKEKATASPKEK